MKILKTFLLFALCAQTAHSAPLVDFIGDLLAGKIKVVSPAEYFAPSDNPPAPDYSAPETTTTTTTTEASVKLFEPAYDPPAPAYDVPGPPAPAYDVPPPPAEKYKVPPPPDSYDVPPLRPSYEVIMISSFRIFLGSEILYNSVCLFVFL